MRSENLQNLIEEFFNKYNLTKDWLENIEIFCRRYDLNIKHLTEILNEPKVIPMIRGKSFEFTVKDYLSNILSEKYQITNPRLNAQVGFNDIDVYIINKQTGNRYSIECKLASKGSFRQNDGLNPYIKVKCMRSRTLGQDAALQRAKITGISSQQLMIHNDQYTTKEFNLVITSIANAFFQTDANGLFFLSPTPEAQPFLQSLGIKNQNEAFLKMYVAKSKDLAANEENKVKCTRKKCQDRNCNFIPNYPIIHFNLETRQPLLPWLAIDRIETLINE